jgi:hypothetical protein
MDIFYCLATPGVKTNSNQIHATTDDQSARQSVFVSSPILLLSATCGFVDVGALSDEWMGLPFTAVYYLPFYMPVFQFLVDMNYLQLYM